MKSGVLDIDPATLHGGLRQDSRHRVGGTQMATPPVEYFNLAMKGIPRVEARRVLVPPATFAGNEPERLAVVEIARAWLRNHWAREA